MKHPYLVECVPNVSEGRDPVKIEAFVRAVEETRGAVLLHRTSDADHHRTVLTFAGPADCVEEAAIRLCEKTTKLLDLNKHAGVHPRLGALDVLPFVPLGDTKLQDCVELAHEAGQRIWDELRVPVYFYEAAALRPDRIKLEQVRRGEFERLRDAAVVERAKAPDVGGPELHPTAGAVIVGARKFLIAFNINLRTIDVGIAKDIAKRIRASSGGLPGIKALGLALESQGLVQVSVNVIDFEATSLQEVFVAVERLAADQGVAIANSELIGLMPRRALEMAAARFLRLDSFDSQRVVETRLETAFAELDSVS